jgi:tape measure domain-containing protein
MALELVGVRLVAEDGTAYIATLNKAGEASDKLSKTLKGVGIAALALGGIRALSGLAQDAMGAFQAHEQLSMSMSSLVAKELRAADSTLTMEAALEKASERSEELLGWIQDLAIASPFDQQGVAMAFRTALAYNFTSEEAQHLTSTMINFATATGQGVDVMQRVSLALGQIKAKGKLAGGEILQLVSAGMSVNPVLEQLGYTTEDVSKGLVSADEFLGAFVKTMDDEFGGAAERSAATMSGLLNSLGDIKEMGLRELFGPVFSAMLPSLTAMVDKMQALIPVLGMVGSGLAKMTAWMMENKTTVLALAAGFSVLFAVMAKAAIMAAFPSLLTAISAAMAPVIAGVTFLLSPIGLLAAALGAVTFGVIKLMGAFKAAQPEIEQAGSGVVSAIGGIQEGVNRLEEPAEESHGWGYNLVMQFANGMAEAISAVMTVLIQLGNAIATWLSPGSPPKLLPDIDKWGESAMDEFLGGFGSADFGLLSDLSGTVEQAMRGFAKTDSKGLVGNIFGSREAIAKAVAELKETGTVGEATISKVIKASQAAGPAMEGYIRAMFEAAKANTAVATAQDKVAQSEAGVKTAQEALNQVTMRYRDMLRPMNDELDAIGRRRQDIIDEQRTAELQAIVSDKNAPAMAKELALMELREIELKKQMQLTTDQQTIAEDAAQTDIDGAIAAQDTAVAELEAAQMAADAAAEQLAAQQGLMDVQAQNNGLLQEQISLLKRLSEAMGGAGAGAGIGGGKGLAGLGKGLEIPPMGEGLEGPLDEVKNKFTEFVDDLKAPFAELGGKWDEVKVAWAAAGLEIIASLQPIRDWYETKILPALDTFKAKWADEIWPAIKTKTAEVWGELEPNLILIRDWLSTTLPTALNTLGTTWATKWGELKTNFLDSVEEIRAKWVDETWPAVQKALEESWTAINTIWDEIGRWINTNLVPWVQFFHEEWDKVWEPIKTDLQSIWDGTLEPIFDKIGEWLKITIIPALKSMLTQWLDTWGGMSSKIDDIREGILGFFDKVQTFAEWLTGTVFDFSFSIPDLPDWMLPGSPLKIHTAWEDFGGYLKTAVFEPKVDMRQAMSLMGNNSPINLPASSRQMGGGGNMTNVTNVTNNMGGNNINNGMDVAFIEAVIERVLIRELA